MPTQPQDRKPAKGEPFRFNGPDGKSHTLPNADKGRKALTGRELRDAALGGDMAQMAYMFKVFEAAKPSQAALDAMYGLPQDEMTDVLQAWGAHGDGDGASLGE